MNAKPVSPEMLIGELLDDAALSLDELARACRMSTGWVVERVDAGLLQPSASTPGQWRFTSASVVRARRMCQLEQTFDAVPELAALTADLIEEVALLRQRLRAAGLDG